MIVSAHNYACDYIPNERPIDAHDGVWHGPFLVVSVPETGQSYVQLVLGMAQKVFSMSGVNLSTKKLSVPRISSSVCSIIARAASILHSDILIFCCSA